MNRARDRITRASNEAYLRKADREKLRAMRREVAELRAEIKRHRLQSARRRRDLLQSMRGQLRGVRRLDQKNRRQMLLDLHEAQREFRAWWAAVRAERRARLEHLANARKGLRAYRANTRERIRAALEGLKRSQSADLDRFDANNDAHALGLFRALEQAEASLSDERRDQAQRRRTARHVSRRKPKPTRRERAEEFTGGVEANLLTAEEHAIWHAARKQILADARRRGITEPDAIAELVRERAEADPDLALEHLQSSADRFLEAELRKKGWM